MKVAAIFVLGFALHFFLNRQTTTTHHELQHQIHVPTGQHVEIMLADGSGMAELRQYPDLPLEI